MQPSNFRRAKRVRIVPLGLVSGLTAVVLLTVLIGTVGAGPSAVQSLHSSPTAKYLTVPSKTFVSGPTGIPQPDDLTLLPGNCMVGTGATLWTEYQNGVNPDGSISSPGAIDYSTLIGYLLTGGIIVQEVNITGHVDGVTADPAQCVVLVTINKDANSSFAVVSPMSGLVTKFSYSPSPTVSGLGGTDSIAIWNRWIYLSHSNPNDTTQATAYRVTLSWSMHIAYLGPLFYDDSTAWDLETHAPVTLHLTDPDSNYVMPSTVPRFAGTLATISQGDGRIVFASMGAHHTVNLDILNLTDNLSGNLPPVDGIAAATFDRGTLYVVDAGANDIVELSTKGFPAGTVFIGEPSDNGNPLVGTLNLNTGVITPFANHLVSPKFMVFVAAPGSVSGGHHHCGGHGYGHDRDGDHDDRGNGRGNSAWTATLDWILLRSESG
jgi:hypothetical protein